MSYTEQIRINTHTSAFRTNDTVRRSISHQDSEISTSFFLFGPSTSTNIISVEKVEDQPKSVPERLEQIKDLACLTDEEVAAILRTSRQTIHNWKNGKPISAKRERHIEAVLDAMSAILRDKPEQNRRILVSSKKGGISYFDLLVQNRIDDVVAIASGDVTSTDLLPPSVSLEAQMGQEEITPETKPVLDTKFSGKI